MKKLLIVAISFLFVTGLSSTAKAIPLSPGGVIPGGFAVSDLSSVYGPVALVASVVDPFVGVDFANNVKFTGTLNQYVYKDAAGLLFGYKFTNDAGSLDAIGRLSTADFSAWTLDVASSGSGTTPDLLLRSSGLGSTVSFDFFNGVPQGGNSDMLWIQTNATWYQTGSTELQDGGNTRVQTWAPSIPDHGNPTPEPASLSLLGLGFLGLFGLKRKLA